MDKEEKEKEVKQCDCHHHHHGGGGGSAVYGIGFVGAVVYYFQHSVVFMDYVWGILKALVWPALVIFRLFTLWKL